MDTLLVADIGGTKSDLAIFSPSSSDLTPLFYKRYQNRSFSDPGVLFDTFFTESGYSPSFGCLAMAAPIRNEIVNLTNHPWEFSAPELKRRYSLNQLLFINDLTAISSAIPVLQNDADVKVIQRGGSGGEICGVVAPGTGLGEGLLVRVAGKNLVVGSEGGHCDFAPVDQEQLLLLEWMMKNHIPVSYENLISGTGLPNLYDYICESEKISFDANTAEEIVQAPDKTKAIIINALGSGPCPACVKTIEMFLSILGSEAGNLALKLYAMGGIYLGGGILPRLVEKFSFEGFLRNFRAKGEMAELMNDFPVYLILRPDAALLGAARYAREVIFGGDGCEN